MTLDAGQNRPQGHHQQQNFGTRLTKSTRTLRDAARALDSETLPVRHDVSDCEARALLDAASIAETPCAPDEAAGMARGLTGLYPAREVNDAAAYAAGITAMLVAYPLRDAKRVCDPVTGLPSRLKWLPTLADVREALEAEKVRRGYIVRNARTLLARNAAKREELDWEKARPAAEERRKQVEMLLRVRRVD